MKVLIVVALLVIVCACGLISSNAYANYTALAAFISGQVVLFVAGYDDPYNRSAR